MEERQAVVRFREETLPPHHPTHGTPDPVVRRVVDFELAEGKARWEQTDFGRPGRFNPWVPRGIGLGLQVKAAELRVAAEAMGALLA